MIGLLNAHFVPVYTSNEDYRGDGRAPAEERAELARIHKEGHAAKLSVGTVHAYVLAPDGRAVDSLHVAEACKPDRLVPMLEAAVKRFNVPAKDPVARPAPQSVAPKAESGQLVLHLTARSLDGKGCWGYFPVENWIVLKPLETEKFVPVAAEKGASWEIDKTVALRLLHHFYPATENNDVGKNEVESASLKATVAWSDGVSARVKLDGALRMKHPFYHKKDDRVVEATVAGYADIQLRHKRVQALRLVTTKATYGDGSFGVAVRSDP